MTGHQVVGIEPELKVMLGFLKTWRGFTSALVCISRGLNGVVVLPEVQKVALRAPRLLLKLYECEGDPESRQVREAMTILDLDFIALPCPNGGTRFRSQVKEIGGKDKLPLLVDDNTQTKVYTAKKIVKYLFSTYLPEGASTEATLPNLMSPGPATTLSLVLSTLGRPTRGITRRPIKNELLLPEPTTDCDISGEEKKWIEVYGFEASPYTRFVREVLSELELPHIQRTLGKGSHKRKEYSARVGKMQVPYLEDHNPKIRAERGGEPVKMFDSMDISNYLQLTYLQDPKMKVNEEPSWLGKTFPPNLTFGLLFLFFVLWFVFF